jgi:hypothetical protein
MGWQDAPPTEDELKWADNPPTKEELAATAVTPDAVIPKWKSATMGATQGASLNFGDEGAGALQAIAKKASSYIPGATEAMGFKPSAEPMEETYRKARDIYRSKDLAAREANPKSYMAGEIGGSFVPMAIPGIGQMTTAKMAALGAMQGLGASEADLTKGEFGKAGFDTATGGAIGGTLGLLGSAAKGVGSRVLNPKWWGDVAETRGAKALGFTKHLLNTGEKMAKARQVARTMWEEGVIKAGNTAEDIAIGIKDLIDRTGADIGGFLRKAGNGFETNSVVDALDKLRPSGSKGQVLTAGAYKRMNEIIDNAIETVQSHGSVIPFEEANGVKSLLQDLVNWNGTKMESKLGRRIAGVTREKIDESLGNMAKSSKVLGTEEIIPEGAVNELTGGRVFRVKPPEEAEAAFNDFLRNKKVYGAAQTAEDAIANRLSSEWGNKLFGLTDTNMTSALAAGKIAAGENPLSVVPALIGKKVGEKMGNTGVSEMAFKAEKGLNQSYNWVKNKIKVDPRSLGKYAPVLMNAGGKGSQQLMINHWVLSNTDPAYREMIRTQQPDNQE